VAEISRGRVYPKPMPTGFHAFHEPNFPPRCVGHVSQGLWQGLPRELLGTLRSFRNSPKSLGYAREVASEGPKGTFGPVRLLVYRSNPCSERCPNPFWDRFLVRTGSMLDALGSFHRRLFGVSRNCQHNI